MAHSPETEHPVKAFGLAASDSSGILSPFSFFRRKMVAGSNTGGLKETQEMIDFAAKHNFTANIELISASYVNTAMERLAKGDVRYRFVIDVGNTTTPSC